MEPWCQPYQTQSESVQQIWHQRIFARLPPTDSNAVAVRLKQVFLLTKDEQSVLTKFAAFTQTNTDDKNGGGMAVVDYYYC